MSVSEITILATLGIAGACVLFMLLVLASAAGQARHRLRLQAECEQLQRGRAAHPHRAKQHRRAA